jgi:outer membrane protein OmpA-like peptidoglycan-associated protein
MNRAILAGSAIAALALAGGLGWISLQRNRDLQRRLADAKRQADALRQESQNYARELDRAVQNGVRTALEAAAGRINAEAETRAAEEAKRLAEAETRVAQEAKKLAEDEARKSRQELTAFQDRREQELNRMQEALARIAATRRTSSGLVIDLANDSFRFDFDKATLRPENREILSRIAGVLLASNGYRLFVHGHTDDVGTDEYNQQLSERRAESVGAYLVSAGVDAGVIETRGFGKSSPRARGNTSDARQENRRVEIVLVDSVIHYQGEVRRDGRS